MSQASLMKNHYPLQKRISQMAVTTKKFGFAASTNSRGGSLMPSVSADEVYDVLEGAGVTAHYPGFRQWFYGRVVLGLEAGDRFGLIATASGRIAGVAIGKRTLIERKLCTLWVAPEMRGNNLATLLAYEAFDYLETDKPLFTVPEERLGEFRGLLRSWNFSPPMVYDGLYRFGRMEYVFNGSLKVSGH